jgi:hypothetical protein
VSFHPFSRKDSAGGKNESITVVQSPQKQNSPDEGLQDIFSSSCNIIRLNPPGKGHSKSVPTNAPVVAAARNKKNEVKSNR